MKLCHLSPESHPLDARCKCLTSAQIQQLATTHRRILPDFEPLHCQAEATAFSAPIAEMSVPPASDVPPDFSPPVTDLTQHLSCLQAQVVLLQQQLTLLDQQLQKEQKWRSSQSPTFKDKSQESSSDKSQESSSDKSQESSSDKSQESSLDKSQESSLDKSSKKKLARNAANTPPTDRRKHSHVLPLVEYGGVQDKYVVISPEQGLLAFEPDSAEWFAWLSTLSSFRNVLVRLVILRFTETNAILAGRGPATRSIRSRSHSLHLVRTEGLTIAVLEQAAASLQSLLN
jgi:hypothetical protein